MPTWIRFDPSLCQYDSSEANCYEVCSYPHRLHRMRRWTIALQRIQPALLGLMDGSVSTLVPIFATAGLTGKPRDAFFVGLTASVGAGISMGLAEALSDDGVASRRGNPVSRGIITGVATAIGGMLHTLPFLLPDLRTALIRAYLVVRSSCWSKRLFAIVICAARLAKQSSRSFLAAQSCLGAASGWAHLA